MVQGLVERSGSQERLRNRPIHRQAKRGVHTETRSRRLSGVRSTVTADK